MNPSKDKIQENKRSNSGLIESTESLSSKKGKIILLRSKIKVKFNGEKLVVDCPWNGPVDAQDWCIFCPKLTDCWGDLSLEGILSHLKKKEISVDKMIKNYMNETLGLKIFSDGGSRRRGE